MESLRGIPIPLSSDSRTSSASSLRSNSGIRSELGDNPRSSSDAGFSSVDLGSPHDVSTVQLYLGSYSDDPGHSRAAATAVNAEEFLAHARKIDAEVQEVQLVLMRLHNAVDDARTLTAAAAVEELAASMGKDLDQAIGTVSRTIKEQLAALQQDMAASLQVAGCGFGTPTHHMRMTVTQAIKNKLRRRRENAQDIESRLNMGIRDTAKKRYLEVIGSTPSEDLVDRLCSPAPPECKLGTLTRWEPQVDEKMATLLKEMDARNRMAIETGKKLERLTRELTFAVDMLEHDELALQYEVKTAKQQRRGLVLWLCLALLVFVFIVVVWPFLVSYVF